LFRRIVRIFEAVLILIAVLWLGNTSISNETAKLNIKSPSTVFSPLLDKLGLSFDIDSDTDADYTVATDNSEDKLTDFSSTSSSATEIDKLASTIRVSTSERDGYDRTVFEKPVRSYTLDGDTLNRNDYAWRTSQYFDEGTFTYTCPYTGIVFTDEYDGKEDNDFNWLDYDHIIPLSYVYTYGDIDWTDEKCNEYAYDQSVGVDVYRKANRSKSDQGPSEWLPNINVENYCYTWLCIASEWDIALRQEDIDICVKYCKEAISSGMTLERID